MIERIRLELFELVGDAVVLACHQIIACAKGVIRALAGSRCAGSTTDGVRPLPRDADVFGALGVRFDEAGDLLAPVGYAGGRDFIVKGTGDMQFFIGA